MKIRQSLYTRLTILVFLILVLGSCSTELEIPLPEETETEIAGNETPTPADPQQPGNSDPQSYSYLALGDSYTIGESVCSGCRFPAQLVSRYNSTTKNSLNVNIIAKTGWRTDDLIQAITADDPDSNYDLVTLLIGVNNQYSNRPFSQYENEFPQLLDKAISLAKGDAKNIIAISIPDYAFTPFGQNTSQPDKISREIDTYNAFAKKIAEDRQVIFLNITDITRRGLAEPILVASDGLHPSSVAYGLFTDRLMPLLTEILK